MAAFSRHATGDRLIRCKTKYPVPTGKLFNIYRLSFIHPADNYFNLLTNRLIPALLCKCLSKELNPLPLLFDDTSL